MDIVIDASGMELDQFLAALKADSYGSPEAAREAFRERGMLNVIDLESGWKADLIFLKPAEFDQAEFSRRSEVELLGVKCFLISPEGSILTKLRWAAESGSERQIRDAASVVRGQGDLLDRDYLWRWAPVLGVQERLAQILGEAR